MSETAHTLSGAGFDAIWRDQIEPELQKKDADRQKAIRTYWLILGGSVVLALILAVAARGSTAVGVVIPLFIIILAAIFGYLPAMKVKKMAKKATIDALCGPLGVTYEPDRFEPGGFSQFLHLKLLPPHNESTFEDQLKGVRGGREFEIYEANLKSGVGKNESIVFSGQLFRIAYPRTLKGTTILKRDGGWLNKLGKPKDMVRIPLTDPRQEKMFEGFADDEAEGRSLLNPVFVEKVAGLEQTFGGKRARCAFTGGQLLIAIEGKDRFEIGSMFKSLVNRQRIERIAADIDAVLKLIDAI